MDHEVSQSLRLTFTIAASAMMLIATVGLTVFFQGNEERGMNALLQRQMKEGYAYPITNCRFGDYMPGATLCNDAEFTAVYDCIVLHGTNNQPVGLRFNRR